MNNQYGFRISYNINAQIQITVEELISNQYTVNIVDGQSIGKYMFTIFIKDGTYDGVYTVKIQTTAGLIVNEI